MHISEHSLLKTRNLDTFLSILKSICNGDKCSGSYLLESPGVLCGEGSAEDEPEMPLEDKLIVMGGAPVAAVELAGVTS